MALLEAAIGAVARSGVVASTAQIARQAGVAEGTLFRYYSTKDELLNEVFFHLKQGLCRAMMANMPRDVDMKSRTRQVWNSLIDWGLANPVYHQAMRQLAVSDKITVETHQRCEELYPELHELSRHCISDEFLRPENRLFGDAIFFSLAETTMEFASGHPEQSESFKSIGFEAIWRALSESSDAGQ